MLGYRSTFEVQLDPAVGLGRDNAIDVLLAEGFMWLRKQKRVRNVDELEPLVERRFKGGDRVIYTKGVTRAGVHYGRLVYYDKPQPVGQWVTSLLVGLDSEDKHINPHVAIEIEAPEDPDNEGHPILTARPKLSQRFFENYACYEHGLAMSGSPEYLRNGSGVERLIEGLVNTHRRNLVIVCAEDGTVSADVWLKTMAKITEQTAGQASVYVLDAHSTARFNELVSDAHTITPYSPRTFRPPVDIDEPQDGRRHKYLTAHTMLNSRSDYINWMYGRLCREHANAQPIDRFLRRLKVITDKEMKGVGQSMGSAVVEPPVLSKASRNSSVEISTRCLEALVTEVGGTCVVNAPHSAGSDFTNELATSVSSTTANDLSGALEVEVTEGSRPFHELVAELNELRAERDCLKEAEADLRAALDQANNAIRRLETERESEVISKMEALEELERKHHRDLEDEHIETLLKEERVRELAEKVRTLGYQLEQARRILVENKIDASGSREKPEVRYEQELGEWEEIRYFGAEKFPNLIFTCDWKKMMDLASRDDSGLWLSTTWESLAMLDYYCDYRNTAEGKSFRGGLREYLKNPPAAAWTISAERFRATESEQVQGTKRLASERVFPVPRSVNSSGEATMLTHIVIQTKGTVSPRLYFLDCTERIGKIVIGYIGRHPRNTKTN